MPLLLLRHVDATPRRQHFSHAAAIMLLPPLRFRCCCHYYRLRAIDILAIVTLLLLRLC